MSDSRLTETGQISSVCDGSVEIRLERTAGCAGCGLCIGGAKGKKMCLVVKAGRGLEIGSRVKVTLPHRSLWRPIFFVFVLPLALLFAFGGAGGYLAARAGAAQGTGALVAAASALAGLLVAFAVAHLADAAFRRRVFEDTTVEPIEGP